MKIAHLAAVTIALVFAFYKTGTVYVRPDLRNLVWAAFSWALLAAVATASWNGRRKKS